MTIGGLDQADRGLCRRVPALPLFLDIDDPANRSHRLESSLFRIPGRY
jgi:hypothetical protein